MSPSSGSSGPAGRTPCSGPWASNPDVPGRRPESAFYWSGQCETAGHDRRLALSYIMGEERYHDPKTRRKNLAEDTQVLLASEASNWEKLRARPGDGGS